MTSLRHELASLLVGYDVERFRREHDRAVSAVHELRVSFGAFIKTFGRTYDVPVDFPIGDAGRYPAIDTICSWCASKPADDCCEWGLALLTFDIASKFLDSLPLGAVKRARERLAER